MMLCNDEIYWGKIVSGNLPPVPITTVAKKTQEKRRFMDMK